MKKRAGVILIAHGSKRSQSNEEFIKLCEKIKLENIVEFDKISYAFLELVKPTIEMAVENMYDENIEQVYLYPYFLNSGKHVSIDIPNIISKMQSIYTNMDIQLLNHFGSSKSVVSIISSDLQEIL
jgi:sirohydrochlorin ferrochelatase